MKKEILYRAWDKKTKTMRQVWNMNWTTNSKHPSIPKGSVSHVHLKGKKGECAIAEHDSYYGQLASEVILMQYTGLKDRNGVKIYEGDILEYWLSDYVEPGDKSCLVPVEWREKHAYFYPLSSGDSCGCCSDAVPDEGEIYNEYGEIIYRLDRHEGKMFCDVVGNIYENPNLLEKTNEENI